MNEICKSERESNTSRLSSALGNLASAISDLENLKDELRGEDRPDCPKDGVGVMPTVFTIMNEWPDRINSFSDVVRTQTQSIREIF